MDDEMAQGAGAGRIVLCLGPTNTGKTHRAIERMLEFRTGMIGLPLRLLAREVYDRVSARIGENAVALVTGEEKRIPKAARYWVATVEAMPRIDVDFLAVDEIQLATGRERGHVFTERLLSFRGRQETWFLGSKAMEGVARSLIGEAETVESPRLSELRYAGAHTLGALPRRSAVVAFSVAKVFEIGERIKHRHGGAAIVMGALSPRARNAQVALYQSGEVGYLVATDAIGMGLNLDLSHVAFAELRKFDGKEARDIELAEVAQIAGRAGRYLDHGTFGVLRTQQGQGERADREGPRFHEATIKAVCAHRFQTISKLQYRNANLDFSSKEALLQSLAERPPHAALVRADKAEDELALVGLLRHPDIAPIELDPRRLEELMRVAQIPDYRKLLTGDHLNTQVRIFQEIVAHGRISLAWISRELDRISIDRDEVDTLMDRVAQIRLWNYVIHQEGWVSDRDLEARAKSIEDSLSDTLHKALVDRFVASSKRAFSTPQGEGPKGKKVPTRTGDASGAAMASGSANSRNPSREKDHSPFAALLKFREGALSGGAPPASRGLEEVFDAPHEAFSVSETGHVLHKEEKLGRLAQGRELTAPRVTLLIDVAGGARMRLERRLLAFTRDYVAELTGPLEALHADLSPPGRGLLHLLMRGLGVTRVSEVREHLEALSPRDRQLFGRVSLEVGRFAVYVPKLLKPPALAARFQLVRAFTGVSALKSLTEPSFAAPRGIAYDVLDATGYLTVGPRAIRADLLERGITRLVEDEELPSGGRLTALFGAGRSDTERVISALPIALLRERHFRDRAPPAAPPTDPI